MDIAARLAARPVVLAPVAGAEDGAGEENPPDESLTHCRKRLRAEHARGQRLVRRERSEKEEAVSKLEHLKQRFHSS